MRAIMIYFDNAATTFPKPDEVCRQMTYFMKSCCANPGRGGHYLSRVAGDKINESRKNIADFFGIKDSNRLIFTFNDTLALNMALHGTLNPGDHVITTVYEHNSIIRPLMKLSQRGVQVTILKGNLNGEFDLEEFKKQIRLNTKLAAITAAFNVLGNVLPINEIGHICREYGILLLVDGAQGAGIIPMDVSKMNIDLLAFPGHKSLYGPMGTACLYIGERADVDDIIQGGTGTVSESITQPKTFPERYESGTINAPGVWGVNAGLNFIKNKGLSEIKKHEMELVNMIINELSNLKGITVLGQNMKDRVPIVSFNIKDINSSEVSALLDKKYEIATRGGLHCAGLFHDMAGTAKQGAVRVSPGYFNTKSDVYKFISSIKKILKQQP